MYDTAAQPDQQLRRRAGRMGSDHADRRLAGPERAGQAPVVERSGYGSTMAGVLAPSVVSTSASGLTRRRCRKPSTDSTRNSAAPANATIPAMNAIWPIFQNA